MTGPSGSSAAVPSASFAVGAKGTPKRMTDRKPFWTSGVMKEINLLRPRRFWFGREGMGVNSLGLSVIKRG